MSILSPELLVFKLLAFRNRYAEMTDIPVVQEYISVPKYYKRIEELEIRLKQFSTEYERPVSRPEAKGKEKDILNSKVRAKNMIAYVRGTSDS